MKDGVITVIAPLKDTPAYAAGVKAGDKILKIDGKITTDMTIDDAINGAMAEGDARSVAALVGTDLKGLELQGRLTGALSEGQTTITAIQIVVPADVQVSKRDTGTGCIDVECEEITVGR